MILKKNLKDYPEVKKFFDRNYKNFIDYLSQFVILEVPNDLWEKFQFNGYGYVVNANKDMWPNHIYLELASKNDSYYNSLPTKEHKRDVNMFRLWDRLKKPDMFIVVKPNAESFIIHELSHLLHSKSSSSPFEHLVFDDAYLNTPSEQFAHLNEMKFCQNKGMSFEEYFKNNWPKEYDIIQKYEKGGYYTISLTDYELSIADRNDFQKMWDYVKDLKND